MDINIRMANKNDAALIVHFMKLLGEYQRMSDKITVTEDKIVQLLEDGLGEAFFAETDGQPVGFIYFYMNSTAFTGNKGIYVDAFYVNEDLRGQGIGKKMMDYLTDIAHVRSCGRIEWVCLDWNLPSIKFYKHLGATQMNVFTTYRLNVD